jgi:hypothetical protein
VKEVPLLWLLEFLVPVFVIVINNRDFLRVRQFLDVPTINGDNNFPTEFLDIKSHAVITDPLIGTATELAELEGLRGSVTEYQLSAVLRRYGFKTKSSRGGKGAAPKYRYSLGNERLEELLARFAGS